MRWSSPDPATGAVRLAPAALTVGLLVACLLTAATCEDQDYLLPSEPLVLTDAAPGVPIVVEIDQPVRGLTSMDFAITNNGPAGAEFTVAASSCVMCRFDSDCPGDVVCEAIGYCAEEDAAATPCGTPPDAVVRTVPLGVDRGVASRFHEGELGVADHLHVEFACFGTPCSGTLEYTLLVRQPDCLDDTDCASDEVCDPEVGFCRSDVSGSGCRLAASTNAPPPWWLLALLGVAAVAARCGRARP